MFNSDSQAISAIQSAAEHLAQSTSVARDKAVDSMQLRMVLKNLLEHAPKAQDDEVEYDAALHAASAVLDQVERVVGKGVVAKS